MKKYFINWIIGVLLMFMFSVTSKAQTSDSLESVIEKLNDELIVLKRLKFSGFIQAQWQLADTAGISSYSGGNFGTNVNNRFSIRRGRLKASYENGFNLGTLQLDITEKGVTLKEAYLKMADPFKQVVSLQLGVFNRPFGFEVPFSSSAFESPERSRMMQVLFPGEGDLGFALILQAPKSSFLNVFKIEGGFFNGIGPTAVDFDSYKDFIGNISFNKSLKNEKASFAARVSYYNGGFRQPTKYIYNQIGDIGGGVPGFLIDSADNNKGGLAKREYLGGDMQISILTFFGLTTIRAEYIQGVQPGTKSSSTSPNADPNDNIYYRNFMGGNAYFLQNIGQTKHQLVLKYDWYDPNTTVKANEIGTKNSKLSKTDLKYSTIGFGWIYRLNENIRFTAYYDFVTNETSENLTGFDKDLKDNVLTLRIQYKF